MNFSQRTQPEKASFQIAPMIDVVFLLLIFFIVTWNFARWETELDVTVPTATEGKESRRTVGEMIINVTEDGSILVNRQPHTAERLRTKLKQLSELYPDQAVILRGDEKVDYKFIVDVLDICRQADIWNVAFATARVEKS